MGVGRRETEGYKLGGKPKALKTNMFPSYGRCQYIGIQIRPNKNIREFVILELEHGLAPQRAEDQA
jgi:hypothetical protein